MTTAGRLILKVHTSSGSGIKFSNILIYDRIIMSSGARQESFEAGTQTIRLMLISATASVQDTIIIMSTSFMRRASIITGMSLPWVTILRSGAMLKQDSQQEEILTGISTCTVAASG